MADFRTQAALVLGVGLGLVLIAFPEAVLRVHMVGRFPHDRGGEYGRDATPSGLITWGIRAIGGVLVIVAIAIWWL
ncbi:MAG: hypothetical protein ABEJ58_00850 [Halodesulfurarchaeum sp.]